MMEYKCGLVFFYAYYLFTTLISLTFAEIVLKPRDTTVKVKDSTILQCSVYPEDQCMLWIHLQPQVNNNDNQNDREVYDCSSGVASNFLERFHVDRNISSGKSNLHIKQVRMEDAGTYECQDQNGYGAKHSANLFVIDDGPKCESSVPLHEVIGPNDCKIPCDDLRLTCSVKYYGPRGRQPILQWQRVGDNQTLNQRCVVVGDRLSCTAMLKANRDLNGTSYLCMTTHSAKNQYSCTTETIRLIHAYNTSSEQNVHLKQKLVCKANCSHECTYTWKKFRSKRDTWTVSHDRVFTPESLGSYRCEAVCPIRNRTCHLIPQIVHVSGEYSPMHGHSSSEQIKFLTNSLYALLIGVSLLYFNWFT